MRKTTTFAVAAGAALALVLTGCGSAAENGTAAPAGQAAPDKNGGSASPFSDALKLADAAKQGTQKAKSVKMTMETSANGQTMKVDGAMRLDGENSAMAMTMSAGAAGNTEVRFVDKTMYMKVPAGMAQQYGTDKQWLKISADGTDPMSQMLGKMMTQSASQSDPTQLLDRVAKTGRIISADKADLNGQPTFHYKVELDVSKSIEEFVKDMPAEVQAEMKKTMQGKDIKIPAEIWTDLDQLPLQVTMDESEFLKSMGGAAAQQAAAGNITIKYTDWGKPVDVAAPPADQVADFSEIMKKKMGGH
ncbi:hypothetical protein [Amycolatopsis benzoatilytica]|uniref:hypothetical protein n=1 Tax=Amycolatopsis benzoatilytica TaxID=346045 RepID=UPI00036251BC|nr:hypothetical protein [Amycolatopsis benzoatilytica]